MLPGGVGVCLEQVQADGRIRPIGYASRTLTRTQLRWDTSRLEAWALVFGLRTFRWALNPDQPHVLVTDHWALKWLRDCVKEETPGHRQLMRCALEIELYGPYAATAPILSSPTSGRTARSWATTCTRLSTQPCGAAWLTRPGHPG